MNFDPSKPIYEQIIDAFKKKILRGELKPEDKMPSQRDVARDMKVNPNTVQRAYREMEYQGIAETRRGQGTFVATDTEKILKLKREMAEKLVNSFLREMTALGFTPEEAENLLEQHIKKEEKTG